MGEDLKNAHPPFQKGSRIRSDFAGIVREVMKLFSRNGRLISSIMLLMIFLKSILSVFNNICIKVPLKDFATSASFLQVYSPNSTEFANLLITMKNDLQSFAQLELIFFCASSFTSLFFLTVLTLGSAATYCGKDFPTKELLSGAVKSMKRPFLTWFYIKLLNLGFFLLTTILLLSSVLLSNSPLIILPSFMIILIAAVVFRIYLACVWTLALVVSVLEEKSGIEALGKAAQLIKGSKRRAFFLNLVAGFSSCVLALIGTVGFAAKAKSIPLLLSTSIISLIMIFLLISYTVLYYECKKAHGENAEMEGSEEHTKMTFADQFTALISADTP